MIINKVQICGVDSSELPVLEEKEIKELLFRLQHGDYECSEKFINGNTRLILSVINRFINRGEDVETLFKIGSIGLIKSIDKFNSGLNVSFKAYAVSMIIGEIRGYLREKSSIRVSRSLMDIGYRALQVRQRLVNEKNKEPTISQISKQLDISPEELVFAMDALQEPVSLFEPIFENISNKEVMKTLSVKENRILNMRFAHGKTQMEVAEEMGISTVQVSRLEKTALKHMKKYI